MAKLKPAIAIREGIFNDLGQMSIKVKRKYGVDKRLLEDVIIHEKTNDYKNRIVIKAKNGELKSKIQTQPFNWSCTTGIDMKKLQVKTIKNE